MTHRIVPALEHLAQPIDSVIPHPDNANEGDAGFLAVQLSTHGQHSPIVVQASTRRIVKGNHTWRAAKALGWTVIAVAEVEDDDLAAIARMVGDNQAGRASRDDPQKLAELLERLHDHGRIEDAGFTANDLDDLLRDIGERVDVRAHDRALPGEGEAPPPPTSHTLHLRVTAEVFEEWLRIVEAEGVSESVVFTRWVETWSRH